MGYTVGIDLGTTYSVIARVNEAGAPEVIPNVSAVDDRFRFIIPSVVYFGASGPVVGAEAKEYQSQDAEDVAAFFKRYMGEPHYARQFHGKDYTPTDLSTLVLRQLKKQAEEALGGPVTHAVITVPAYFTHHQRVETMRAGKDAGLSVLSIISEPTAAALAYGLRPDASGRLLLVYDLGGGTFDVSLVEITQRELRVIATDGDRQLGGRDWDDRLAVYLQEQFQRQFGVDPMADNYDEMLVIAERLKQSLSARQSADARISAAGDSASYRVTRELFEELTGDLLERTQQLTERVLEHAEPRRTWEDISGVVPVGGSTRMPMVREWIERMSHMPPLSGVNPDEAVALGAAIQAAKEMAAASRMQLGAASAGTLPRLPEAAKDVQDVIAHSLGMIAVSDDNERYTNTHLLRKNQPIPSSHTRPYTMRARRNGATEMDVYLTQGESDDPQDCAYLGRYLFDGFPAGVGPDIVVDVTYSYDKNGIVQVAARERSTGAQLTLHEEQLPQDVPTRFAGKPLAEQAREPMTLYLAFDLSGSMSGKPLQEAKHAAEAFVSQCDLTTAAVGLIEFSDSVRVSLHASHNADEIHRAIARLSIGTTGYGNGGDPFDDILAQMQNTTGRRYAIVLADGVWSHQGRAEERARRCHAAGVEIIAIGFGGADEDFLKRIASSSEQGFFTDLNRLGDVFSTIAQVLTEGESVGARLQKLR